MQNNLSESLQKDLRNISQIPIVKSLLDVVCQTTGMGFAAIARVTEDNWLACGVRDDISFGLKPGEELKIKTTICDEIRDNGKCVVINHVAEDEAFKHHHTPAMYGFQSYVSVPVFRRDGSFFGTLCAIDPNPNQLDTPEVLGMFNLFADLISFHLEAVEQNDDNESKLLSERSFNKKLEVKIEERTRELEASNEALAKMNMELQSFTYISSHDLQEPLRKIQIFVNIISDQELQNLSDSGKDYFRRLQNAAQRMRVLIDDLLSYSHANFDERKFETTDLMTIAQTVKEDLREEIDEKRAVVEIGEMAEASVIRFQFRQLLFNLVSNSLKFIKAGQKPHIKIQSKIASGAELHHDKLVPEVLYCHVSVSDNGIGFDPQYGEKIFELFQRLHDRSLYSGTGIGLAIVKKITENHQGLIFATSNHDSGATFDIYLPAGIVSTKS